MKVPFICKKTAIKRYPCLIVEVLSSSTEAFDRGEKFANYRQLESLQEYVLITPEKLNVECFRRNAEGRWQLYPYNQGEEIHLASIDFRCLVGELYEDVAIANESASF